MTADDARYTREIKSRIAIAKSSIRQAEDSFQQQIGLTFKEETSEIYIWSIALYIVETCTLREVYQKYLGSFEMWC